MKDSNIISIYLDTASKALEVGCKSDNHVYKVDLGNPKAALERTNLGIQLLCEKGAFLLKDVDCFYCLLGPGSNTGIRLGLTIPRTIYAFNPKIRLFGIPTLDLFCTEGDRAAISDRNGNLFYAEKKDGKVTYRRVDRKDIQNLDKDAPIVVEEKDTMAVQELQGYHLKKINVLSLMIEHEKEFKDFSEDEENFLPEYLMKI